MAQQGITRQEALKRMGLASAVLAFPGTLTACFGDDDSSDSEGGAAKTSSSEIDHIRWAIPGASIVNLDIGQAFEGAAQTVQSTGLEGLLTFDDKLALKPLLATEFSQPDNKTYVFTLRQGVKFWDGTPLTAEDVRYSLERHSNPKSGSQVASYWGSVASIRVTGDDQITIALKQPDPVLKYAAVFTPVIQKAAAERAGKSLGAPGTSINVIGTGPYKFTSFPNATTATVERNEAYWGEKPRVRRATFTCIPDAKNRELAHRSGDIDGSFYVPLTQVNQWKRIQGLEIQTTPGLQTTVMSFDVAAEPWNDIHVRRAIAHASDRAGYVKAFLGGNGEPAVSITPPSQWGDVLSQTEVAELYKTFPDYEFDVDKARAELEQSAHPNGFSAEVLINSQYPDQVDSFVSLSQTLEELGIKLDVKEVTTNKWLSNIFSHDDLGICAIFLGPDYPDPANYPNLVLPSKNAVPNNFNFANFKNDEVDRLLETAAESTDNATRGKAIGEALKITQEELPYLPLYWGNIAMAINSKYAYPGFNGLFYMQDWLSGIGERAT